MHEKKLLQSMRIAFPCKVEAACLIGLVIPLFFTATQGVPASVRARISATHRHSGVSSHTRNSSRLRAELAFVNWRRYAKEPPRQFSIPKRLFITVPNKYRPSSVAQVGMQGDLKSLVLTVHYLPKLKL